MSVQTLLSGSDGWTPNKQQKVKFPLPLSMTHSAYCAENLNHMGRQENDSSLESELKCLKHEDKRKCAQTLNGFVFILNVKTLNPLKTLYQKGM